MSSNNDVVSYINSIKFTDRKMALRYSNLLKIVGTSIKDLEVVFRNDKPVGFKYFDYRIEKVVEE